MLATLVKRRDFLKLFWIVISMGGGLLGCKGRGSTERTEPRAEAGVKVARLNNLREGNNYFTIERVILTKRGPNVTAMSLVCTHQECLLKPDDIRNDKSPQLICPCHGSIFDPNGRVLTGPAKRDLYRYPVTVTDDGDVLVRFSDPL